MRFVTGNSRKGRLPEDVDWRAIADPSTTTIFYMAGRTAGEIATRLIETGCSPWAPVTVAVSLGRRDQILRSTDLRGLCATIKQVGLSKPPIIGVGQAFAQRQNAKASPAIRIAEAVLF